jgi:hypothetical protein
MENGHLIKSPGVGPQVFEQHRSLVLHRTPSSVLFHRGRGGGGSNIVGCSRSSDVICRAKICIATLITTLQLHPIGCSKMTSFRNHLRDFKGGLKARRGKFLFFILSIQSSVVLMKAF